MSFHLYLEESIMVDHTHKKVYVIDGARTPYLKAAGRPGNFSAADLLVAAGRPLLTRQPFSPDQLSEVIVGSVIPSADEANIARVASLRLGCSHRIPAWTVQRNCGSGMQAVDTAMQRIRGGYSQIVLAGGVEAMSRAPLQLKDEFVHWLADLNRAKSISAKFRILSKLKPSMLKPEISLLRGLNDPKVNLSMGQTAEILAKQFSIDRESMDSYALQSHLRLARAVDNGLLHEIEPLFDTAGNVYTADNGLHRNSTMAKLLGLRPVFDKRFGNITAGNSAQVTDGAALLILCDEETVKKYDLSPLGLVEDCIWTGVPPEIMGLGPVHSIAGLLDKHELTIDDIDRWEINEAFAAQVLACLAALASEEYCKVHFHKEKPYGVIDQNMLNVDGGAISLGHPVGSSGARIVLHLFHILRESGKDTGIASLCIGGGQGGAMLLKAFHNHES